MLTKQTQQILKSLVSINNSFIVTYPEMTITDEFKSLIGIVNISYFESEFKEFGIFDGTSFLSSLDLLEDPSITFEDNLIKAKDKNTSMNFLTSFPSTLEDCVVNKVLIEKTVAVDSLLEFEFNEEILSKIKKASSVFKIFNTLFVENVNGVLSLRIGSKDTFNKSENAYSINIGTNSEKDFSLSVPLENILKLPNTGYTLKVKYNQERDVYRIVMDNEIYTFVLSLME